MPVIGQESSEYSNDKEVKLDKEKVGNFVSGFKGEKPMDKEKTSMGSSLDAMKRRLGMLVDG